MIELFTEMMLRAGLGVHLRVGEIDNSRRLGFLVGKLIMLEGLEFWVWLREIGTKDCGISPDEGGGG